MELLVIDNPQPRGFGENHNAAFARCTQPFFCVVNPDILLPTDPFNALLHCFEDSRLGLVAPVVTTPALVVENTARSLYTPIELIRQKLSPHNRGTNADWLAGMFLLFRSEAYRAIGGFDERYFLYIETWTSAPACGSRAGGSRSAKPAASSTTPASRAIGR